MTLLIDFLDAASAYIHGKRDELSKLEKQYRKIYDPDIVREMKVLRRDISKKRSEIKNELLLNLDEFRAINKYFPELLSAFMEDEYIGKVLTGKAWMLDFKSMPPQLAAAKLAELTTWRRQLHEARRSIRGGAGLVRTKPIVDTYPVLRASLKGDMDRKDVLNAIDELDEALRKEGWLVLLSDSLIKIPLAKFMNKVTELRIQELQAKAEVLRMRNKGTIAETRALRALQEIVVKRQHYETIVAQILLANPEFLDSIKKKKSWLSKERGDVVERFAQSVTPHKIKERAWLNEMRKRIKEAG